MKARKPELCFLRKLKTDEKARTVSIPAAGCAACRDYNLGFQPVWRRPHLRAGTDRTCVCCSSWILDCNVLSESPLGQD